MDKAIVDKYSRTVKDNYSKLGVHEVRGVYNTIQNNMDSFRDTILMNTEAIEDGDLEYSSDYNDMYFPITPSKGGLGAFYLSGEPISLIHRNKYVEYVLDSIREVFYE